MTGAKVAGILMGVDTLNGGFDRGGVEPLLGVRTACSRVGQGVMCTGLLRALGGEGAGAGGPFILSCSRRDPISITEVGVDEQGE